MGEPDEYVLIRPDGIQERWSSLEAFLRGCARMTIEKRGKDVADWLEEHYGALVRYHIGEWGGHEEWGADARDLIDLVFGKEASGFVVNGPLTGDTVTPGAVPLREDRATEADIEVVASRLREWGQGIGGLEEYRRESRELLALVFGEEASRV
jgi:hypothetical protein